MCKHCVRTPTRTIFLPLPYEPLKFEWLVLPPDDGGFAEMVRWHDAQVSAIWSERLEAINGAIARLQPQQEG